MEKISDLMEIIPEKEWREILSQDKCEISPYFMCFEEPYKAVSKVAPKHFTIVDLGCYLSAQSYYFAEHEAYVGVDVCTLKRFAPANATHYVGTIQDYIKEHEGEDTSEIFAICSYIPDEEAVAMARAHFKNILTYYPHKSVREDVKRLKKHLTEKGERNA